MLDVNEGSFDRFLRVLLGIVLIGVGFGAMSGGGGIALGIIGVIVFFTGVSGRCLIYKLINFNTRGVR